MNLSKQDLEEITKLLNRKPTELEKYIFDTMWSEHCSYKSSKKVLKKYLPTKGKNVLLGIGEDAGIVKFTEFNNKKYAICMAHESHNHPSQILPVEGAATGVGGIVRDVYCMGADVIGVLDSLHFGIAKKENDSIVDEIAEEVVHGVSDYANPLGVPVLGGETIYHPSYNENCLVNVGALGILEEKDLIHSRVPKEADKEPYVIILIGKSTDATGFGGASFASATLDNEEKNIGAVQVHDPFLKRVLVTAIKHFFKVVEEKNISIGFKDLGAGGIACATSEIAAAAGYGVRIDLENVNAVNKDLPPEVIACSETQERFCLAIPKKHADLALKIFNEEFDLGKIYHKAGAVVIGDVIKEPFYKIINKGNELCSLPIQAITSEVLAERFSKPRQINSSPETNELKPLELEKVLLEILKLPNVKSKKYVYRNYDQAVRGDTILYPGEADSVVITPIPGCNVGLTVNMSSNLYGEDDPFTSGAYAVAEAIRNIICVGGEPLALTDCLNYGNPEKPEVFFDFEEGIKGIAEACRFFSFDKKESLPIISGNVSFYNESKSGTAIIPSPVIMVVGRVNDFKIAKSQQIKAVNSHLIMIGKRYSEFGGTQIKNIISELNSTAPQVRFAEEAKMNEIIFDLVNKEKFLAIKDISMGGLYVSLIEMILGERGNFKFGAKINIPHSQHEILNLLFSENGGYLAEVNDTELAYVRKRLLEKDIYFQIIGKTISEQILKMNQNQEQITLDLHMLKNIWNPFY